LNYSRILETGANFLAKEKFTASSLHSKSRINLVKFFSHDPF
jgi:hypothetical protein